MIIEGVNLTFLKMISSNLDTIKMLKYFDNEQKIDLKNLYPSLFEEESLEKMKTAQGLEASLYNYQLIELFSSIIVEDNINLDNQALSEEYISYF